MNSQRVADEIQLIGKYKSKIEDAKERSIDFDLTFSEYKKIAVKKLCFYCGCKLIKAAVGQKPNMISVERLSESVGYTKPNCVASCYKCNTTKNAILNAYSKVDKATFDKFLSIIYQFNPK